MSNKLQLPHSEPQISERSLVKVLQMYAFRVELNIKERVRLANSRFISPARSANEEE